jgi:OmpA-OmpF porin, OOP family
MAQRYEFARSLERLALTRQGLHYNGRLEDAMNPRCPSLGLLALALAMHGSAADIPGSQDPAGVKRYTGSEIIGYHAPQFDEFLLPLGPPTEFAPPAYAKSLQAAGLVSRYTYLAPAGRSPAELFRNYQIEAQRLGLTPLYQKDAGQKGWFGPTLNQVADEDQIGQILAYNESQERVLVAKSKDAKPTYYYLFVTSYRDGVIPERLRDSVAKESALAELIVIAPQAMEENMTLLHAAEMSAALADSGRVALYGIQFDTDKDTLRPDSQPTLDEIGKLLADNPRLNLHVVGHTDNQGKPDYNLDLSRRRAAVVAGLLTARYGVAANRLDAFGCGPYAPAASNDTEDGRAKNRRVELVQW